MGYWKCCFLVKLEDLSVLSLWGKDPKGSHSNKHNIIPANHTPASAQEPGPFPGSFHLIVCSNPAGSLHECLLRESRGKGRPQNSRRTRPARQTCNSAVWIFYKQKAVLPSPSLANPQDDIFLTTMNSPPFCSTSAVSISSSMAFLFPIIFTARAIKSFFGSQSLNGGEKKKQHIYCQDNFSSITDCGTSTMNNSWCAEDSMHSNVFKWFIESDFKILSFWGMFFP